MTLTTQDFHDLAAKTGIDVDDLQQLDRDVNELGVVHLMLALADERARSARLRRYGELWEDDFREQMQGQHDEFVEKTIQQMRSECLQPGDLDDAAPARGGGAR